MSSSEIAEGDEIWLGDVSVAGEEFLAAMEAVEELQETLREFQDDIDSMDVGLDRDDAVNLLYARNHSLNKTQVKMAFEVIDAFVEEDLDDVAPRILADQTSELTIGEAAEVWDDMVRLAEKYGSLKDQTEETDQ